MQSWISELKKNPMLYFIVALVIFFYVPELRVYLIILGIVLLIVLKGENGFIIYLMYNTLGSFLSLLLFVIPNNSIIHVSVYNSLTLLSVGTISSILDVLLYVQSSGWTWFHHSLSAFGSLAVIFLYYKYIK